MLYREDGHPLKNYWQWVKQVFVSKQSKNCFVFKAGISVCKHPSRAAGNRERPYLDRKKISTIHQLAQQFYIKMFLTTISSVIHLFKIFDALLSHFKK